MNFNFSDVIDRLQGLVADVWFAIPGVVIGILFLVGRRIQDDVGIGYSDDIETAARVILETLADVPDVEKEPEPEVLVVDLAPYQVTLPMRWWIVPPRRRNAIDATHRVLSAVKMALLDYGIDLPYPTQQVLFHDQTEETAGDRRRQREGWPPGKDAVPAASQIAGVLRSALPIR